VERTHAARVVGIDRDSPDVLDRAAIQDPAERDFNSNMEPHWQTFDLRSIAWPDPAVIGSIDAPPFR
jgi:hypothetical protein